MRGDRRASNRGERDKRTRAQRGTRSDKGTRTDGEKMMRGAERKKDESEAEKNSPTPTLNGAIALTPAENPRSPYLRSSLRL
jgi:hypothetical protein